MVQAPSRWLFTEKALEIYLKMGDSATGKRGREARADFVGFRFAPTNLH
jgi:hypothetical protein